MHSHHRLSNPQPSGLQHNALTTALPRPLQLLRVSFLPCNICSLQRGIQWRVVGMPVAVWSALCLAVLGFIAPNITVYLAWQVDSLPVIESTPSASREVCRQLAHVYTVLLECLGSDYWGHGPRVTKGSVTVGEAVPFAVRYRRNIIVGSSHLSQNWSCCISLNSVGLSPNIM
jgi:hypothetical protein